MAELKNKKNFKTYEFRDHASDEGHYNSPGIDIPVAGFCRTKYKSYKEYHSSADNLNIVSESSLEEHGAVSETVAREMVSGLCQRLELDCGIAVTGIAGPGGATVEKPVGTVYIGVKAGEQTEVLHLHYDYDRRGVRERSRRKALITLWEMLVKQNSSQY